MCLVKVLWFIWQDIWIFNNIQIFFKKTRLPYNLRFLVFKVTRLNVEALWEDWWKRSRNGQLGHTMLSFPSHHLWHVWYIHVYFMFWESSDPKRSGVKDLILWSSVLGVLWGSGRWGFVGGPWLTKGCPWNQLWDSDPCSRLPSWLMSRGICSALHSPLLLSSALISDLWQGEVTNLEIRSSEC